MCPPHTHTHILYVKIQHFVLCFFFWAGKPQEFDMSSFDHVLFTLIGQIMMNTYGILYEEYFMETQKLCLHVQTGAYSLRAFLKP